MEKSYFHKNRLYWLILINVIVMVFVLVINKKITFGSVSFSASAINDCYSTSRLKNSSSNLCRWKFHHYSPSSWELYWFNNISVLQNSVCPTLLKDDQTNNSITTLEYIIQLQKKVYHHSSPSNPHDTLFSKMHYQYECADVNQSSRSISQYIEPLVGLLRDPLQLCAYGNRSKGHRLDGMESLQSKRFILLGPSAPYQNFRTSDAVIPPWLYQEGSQKILFDLGSSYFNGLDETGGLGPLIGTRWFYEYFRQNSLQFDRIIAFESSQYKPAAYWDQIPDDIVGRLTFINRDVEKIGKFNPWNILKSIGKQEDYVLIKLDIDQATLESDLIDQIMNDSSIALLIDEMFFEMHVSVAEMMPFWGAQPGNLQDSYILFTKLRKLGIRMHSWP